MRLKALLLLFLLALPLAATAQDVPLAEYDVPLPAGLTYADAIPTPQEVVGYRVGARHTESARIVRFFDAVAAASPRVMLEGHGESYEQRPLVHAVVSSPENLARLDGIVAANQRLSETPGEVSDADLAGMPAVVYMGYGVHGNEASGPEAAMLLLYHLAAGEGESVEQVLENTVVLIDPNFNPDGRDRFVDWVNRNRGGVPVADVQDMEHDEPWPGGRTNHYWFDLNRDWLPGVHPESQGRLALFHRYRPQFLTDYHEMGRNATYFFQPGIPSRTNPLTPELNQELTGAIAEYHARYLDRIGSLYYTEESFDDFYYGKGSTYPDVNGAVGVLFEQASSRALKTETDHGEMDYAFTVRNQFMTSLSSVTAAAEMREDLLRYQRDYYEGAADAAGDSPVKAWVVSTERFPQRAAALARTLERHRVELFDLARPVEEGGEEIEEGFIVPVEQNQSRLVRAFMETRTSFPDSLFYDVSTWTLPLAFGVDYVELDRERGGLRGAPLQVQQLEAGRLLSADAPYGYVIEMDRYYAHRALDEILRTEAVVRLMHDPFTARTPDGDRAFARGSVVVSAQEAPFGADSLASMMERLTRRDGISATAVLTGLTSEGPDLGSRAATMLQAPTIGLFAGPGTSSYDVGETWYLLSERFQMPVSLLRLGDAGSMELDKYDVLIAPDGYYGSRQVDGLAEWVQEGGHLIAIGNAVPWSGALGLPALEQREGADLDSLLAERPYEEIDRARGAQYIGGAILRGETDTSHPIGYAMPEEAALFRTGTTFFDLAEAEPGALVVRYTDDPHWSGYVSEERRDTAAGAVAVASLDHGRGQVTYFANAPTFRGFWYGTHGLLLNAIYFTGAW